MPVLKNIRKEKFAQLLAQGMVSHEAYEKAGFKPNRGNATRLKSNEAISQRVLELQASAAQKAEVKIETVLKELARIGFSDLRKAFTSSGAILPPEQWDDDLASAISSVEVVSRQTGEKDEKGRSIVEYVHKLKLWDKNIALDKIARHLGMFLERHDHTSSDGSFKALPTEIRIVAAPFPVDVKQGDGE